MNFMIPEDKMEQLKIWKREQDSKVIAGQKDKLPGLDVPYYGCFHDGYTYSFTPMSVGMSRTVKNNNTKEELDLSDDL